MSLQYHIGLDKDDGANYAILPGDPGRVKSIAEYLDRPKALAENREYTSYEGYLDGERVLVTSTGIGGPSAAIAIEELYNIGVRTFIRVGTTGAMQLEILGGDLIIATGAIRNEGTSKEYLPIEYPAVADYSVLSSLVKASSKLGHNYHTGVVHSKDSFYGQHSPERMPIAHELKSKWDAYIKSGALSSEMECAALFSVASYLGARAGCILNVLWNQEREKANLNNPYHMSMDRAIETAIEALRYLIAEDRLDK